MSDACLGPFIRCGDEEVTVESSKSSQSQFNHSVHNSLLGTYNDIPLTFLKTDRTYSVNYSSNESKDVSKGVRAHPNYNLQICADTTSSMSGSASEDCTITTTEILFYDYHRKILLLNERVETINFNIHSGETALIRGKWGNSHHLKIKIKDTKVFGVQKFRLISILEGIDTYLYTLNYEMDPFPESTGMATWGLYGNLVEKDATNYEPGVQLILLYPQPASLGIPLNSGGAHGGDVCHYGFYDYNAKEGGFISTDLPRLDGGKDMFYPVWCRNMLFDQAWRDAADRRFSVFFDKGKLTDSIYTCPLPPYYRNSVGQMIYHELKGGFYSFTVVDRNGDFHTFNGIRSPGVIPQGEIAVYGKPVTPFVTDKVHTNFASLGFL